MNCLLCNKSNLIDLGKPISIKESSPYIRKDYRVVMCKDCEFYFVNPKIDLSIEEWSQLYGSEYFFELNEWHKTERLNDIYNRLERMSVYSKDLIINFLDIGCGEGLALIEATKRKWNAFGNDISDNRVREAKSNEISFKLGDLLSANYPENFFDFVHMDSVLEHLINPNEYLKELNRIMKKNGILYIGIPNENSLFDNFRQIIFKFIGKSRYSAKLKPFAPPFHVSGFTKKSLGIISSQTGFSIIQLKNFATHFEYKKYSPYTKSFWIHFLFLPIDLAAIPLKMEKYYAIYLRKE